MSIPTPYRRIRVKPLSGSGGAEIAGVNLAQPIDEETVAELRRAFSEHLAIGFRDQRLTPGQLLDFARLWGDVSLHGFARTLPDAPGVTLLQRESATATANFGGLWHADTTMLEAPPTATLLYGIDVPPVGGDTLFANLQSAYDALSSGMRRLLDPLVVMHSAARNYDPFRGDLDPSKVEPVPREQILDMLDEIRRETPHPLIRLDPLTGRKALWMVGDYCMRFADMSEAESQPLLNYLMSHATNPNFTFRWRWSAGALLLWDNRATIHFALNDYPSHRREMLRVQVGAERPVGPGSAADDRADT